MARPKAVATYARELAKVLNPDQLRQLSGHILEAAEKPRLDKAVHKRAQKAVQSASVRLESAEEKLSVLLAEAGWSNSEINDEIRGLKDNASKERVAGKTAA